MRPSMRAVSFGLVALMALICTSPAFSQSGSNEPYAPYEEEEFPRWMHLLRRAEVVFIGSFPVMMLFSSLAFDGYRFTREVITPSQDIEDRPSFGNFDPDERRGLLVAGLSLSGLVTLIDLIIELRR